MVYLAEPSLIQATKAHCTFKRKEKIICALKSANMEEDVLQLADDVFWMNAFPVSYMYKRHIKITTRITTVISRLVDEYEGCQLQFLHVDWSLRMHNVLPHVAVLTRWLLIVRALLSLVPSRPCAPRREHLVFLVRFLVTNTFLIRNVGWPMKLWSA